MAALSEIEKLEARYAENPDGRYFAPLADAYRKAHRLDEALQLIQQGLVKHPEYLSAHIVLGRCHLDAKDDAAAAATFESVLTLDSENIIALKSLAEIAERVDQPLDARRWLHKLLLVDPTNVDAEADLRRLGGPPPEEAAAEPAVEESPAAEISFADIASEPVEAPASAATIEMAPVAVPVAGLDLEPPLDLAAAASGSTDLGPGVVPFDDSLEWGAGERTSRAIHMEDITEAPHEATAAAIDFLGSVPLPDTPLVPMEEMATQPMEGIQLPGDLGAGTSATEEAPRSVWEPPPEVAEVDLAAEPASGVSAFDEAGVDVSGGLSIDLETEAEAEPAGAWDGGPAASTSDLHLIMPEDVTPPEELRRPSGRMAHAPSEPPSEPADAPGEPMLTETMGDLYLRQGHKSEAADVYRRLLSQRPGDAGLAAKLAAIESPPPSLGAAALGLEPLGGWLRRVARSTLAAPVTAAPVEPPPGPSPMEQAFAAPEPERPSEPMGEPARPASDAFTLDQVFGAESAAPPPAAVATPIVPSPGASFDEFFGTEGQAAPTTSDEGAEPAGEEDLSSFNAWLHGLKR